MQSHRRAACRRAADYNGLVKKYCVGCHNDRNKDRAGSLTLASFDIAKAGQEADVAERMIRKLQASMMPPPGMPRPEPAVYQGFIRTLENDRRRAREGESESRRPHVPAPESPRVRARRQGSARRSTSMPASGCRIDTMSANFDNIADEQALSPTLLESYLNAAGDISRMAVGDKNAPSIDKTYTNPTYVSQHPWDHVEGAPYGTRGGMVVDHVFPADGEYAFEMTFTSATTRASRTSTFRSTASAWRCSRTRTGPQIAADGRGATPLLHRADPRQGRPAQGRRRVRQAASTARTKI